MQVSAPHHTNTLLHLRWSDQTIVISCPVDSNPQTFGIRPNESVSTIGGRMPTRKDPGKDEDTATQVLFICMSITLMFLFLIQFKLSFPDFPR